MEGTNSEVTEENIRISLVQTTSDVKYLEITLLCIGILNKVGLNGKIKDRKLFVELCLNTCQQVAVCSACKSLFLQLAIKLSFETS